ncbi:MAG: hypothetical protein CMF48_02125 [Legionellales bacterium]|nr:hypothetical protein [Legionellales bacterium]|tara:strand:+ start:1802 stop:2479 length:678 start_codon:yes stop_codon:yes gene_type:complete
MKWSQVACQQSPDGLMVEAYKTSPEAKEYTYCIAGTHGDEVESVLVMHHWFNWLQDQKSLPNLMIIPVLNVDGLARGTRVNANGVDLNRNLPSSNWASDHSHERYFPGQWPLSEVENQFLSEMMKRYPAKQIISLHSWKPFLQYDDNRVSNLASYLSSKNGYDIVDGDIDNHPTPGSLSTWAQEVMDVPVLTIEFPEIDHHMSVSKIINDNMPAFKGLIDDRVID